MTMIPVKSGQHHQPAPWRAASLLSLFAFLLLPACGPDEPKKQQAAPPASVVVEAAHMKDITEQRTFTGRIEAVDTVQIRARVQGFLNKRDFREGEEVSKGQLLFEIEREPFEIAVEQAEANLVSARAALTLAQQTFERTKQLVKRNTASKASLDDAQSVLLQAGATVKAREADLHKAKLNLGYTRITAPMDGLVGRSAYSVGNLVGPESNPLVNLVAQDPMYVTFPVPQWILLEVRKYKGTGNAAFVRLQLADGSTYDQQGQIRFTDAQATSSTDSVTVRASIPNPQRLLVDQQLVQVSVVRKQPVRKLVISQSALLLDQQGPYVLAVGKDNKVMIKRITTGQQRGSLIIVTSGLDIGDRLIISGHQKARPGALVIPQIAKEDGVKSKSAD